MVKIRYFKIRLPRIGSLSDLADNSNKISNWSNINLLKSSYGELIVTVTTSRELRTIQYLIDGSTVAGVAMTMEQHSIRLFRQGENFFLALLDPPRGAKIVNDFLDVLLAGQEYFIEPLELARAIIERHISSFESSRLVSAKVRDFQIYEKAIARLEVTSKEGLLPEIAPFLEGKFHRVDSLTYEVTHKFRKGLINYSANGTIRVSAPLVEVGFQTFEARL